MVTYLYSAGAKLSPGSRVNEVFRVPFRFLSLDQLNSETENTSHTIHKFSALCHELRFKSHLCGFGTRIFGLIIKVF
jgi:hypothetical protein